MNQPGFQDTTPTEPLPRFTTEEVRLGDVLDKFIREESNTGNQDAPSYIFGKFPDGSIPGLRKTLEWQSVISNVANGDFTEGLYSVPAFRDISAVAQAITPERMNTKTSYVALQPLGRVDSR
ncbi:MAG TPA: hypothetical protein VFB59_00680 [Candidatus Saccharimonadales bacterium]|nr:hypothetical protein [Candidatus Saccharimonadales bacterium]